MKIFPLILGAVSVCACTVVSSPTAPMAAVTADALLLEGFEPAFYRAFVRNGYESPDRLEPVRILRVPPRIYVRTADEGGRAIDRTTLETTERALAESVRIWSGGTFGIAEVLRGAGTRERVPGWITVKWSSVPIDGGGCGRSTVGVDGGFIEFNVSGSCSCGLETRVYPRLVRHELGHAMGYYHTDDAADVMYGRPISPTACEVMPSERERRHARFAHASSQ